MAASSGTAEFPQETSHTPRHTTRRTGSNALLSGFYDDQSLSLILANITGGPNATWMMHGSIMIAQNGWPVPIGFGIATEGREAFDAVVAAREQADTEMKPALFLGRELDALPVDGPSGPVGLAASLYDESSSVSLKPYLAQRLPFLSYHRAYAVACADRFHAPAREYRVIGNRLAEFSYIPFNKYETWETYVADRFPVLSEAYERFIVGWPVPGLVGRRCRSAHAFQLPCWIHEMNPSRDLCNMCNRPLRKRYFQS